MNNLTQLEHRLTRLESHMHAQQRSIRRSRAACALLGCALIGTIGLAAAAHRPVENVIQAHRFEIVDENNNLVAALGADELGGRIDLWTRGGRNVFRGATSESGGDLTIWNAEGTAVYGAYATETGSEAAHWNADGRPTSVIIADAEGGHVRLLTDHDQPSLHLNSTARGGELRTYNAAGMPAIFAGLNEHGTVIDLHDAGGRRLTHLSASNDRGLLRIDSPDGSAIATLGAHQDGGALTVSDNDGRMAGTIGATNRGGRFALLNQTGRPIFDADATDEHHGRLRIRYADGGDRVIASANASGGSIDLRNADDVTVVQASSGDGTAGGYMRLFNHEGNRVFTAGGKPDGTGQIALFTGRDRPVFTVDALADVGSVMALMNADGTRLFAVATHEHGGLMNIMNASGVPIVVAGYSPEGRGGAVTLKNARGIPILHSGTDTTESGVIHIWDADGKRQRTIHHAQ